MNGIARWGGTDIESLLPVSIARHDDRAEVVQGFRFQIDAPDQPIVAGLPWSTADWTLCGYNRVTLKPRAALVASYQEDPLIACWEFNAGRTAVFTSDFAPHRAGSFVHWKHYGAFWAQLIHWRAKRL